MIALLVAFAPEFSKPVWVLAQVLLVGAILSPVPLKNPIGVYWQVGWLQCCADIRPDGYGRSVVI